MPAMTKRRTEAAFAVGPVMLETILSIGPFQGMVSPPVPAKAGERVQRRIAVATTRTRFRRVIGESPSKRREAGLVADEAADPDEVGHAAAEVVAGSDDDEIDRPGDLGKLRGDAVSLG